MAEILEYRAFERHRAATSKERLKTGARRISTVSRTLGAPSSSPHRVSPAESEGYLNRDEPELILTGLRL
jgi:hypothetical protein